MLAFRSKQPAHLVLCTRRWFLLVQSENTAEDTAADTAADALLDYHTEGVETESQEEFDHHYLHRHRESIRDVVVLEDGPCLAEVASLSSGRHRCETLLSRPLRMLVSAASTPRVGAGDTIAVMCVRTSHHRRRRWAKKPNSAASRSIAVILSIADRVGWPSEMAGEGAGATGPVRKPKSAEAV